MPSSSRPALRLLQTRWRADWLEFAVEIADALLERFEDRERGGFWFTAHDHEALMHRSKSFSDDSLPAGNGVAAHVARPPRPSPRRDPVPRCGGADPRRRVGRCLRDAPCPRGDADRARGVPGTAPDHRAPRAGRGPWSAGGRGAPRPTRRGATWSRCRTTRLDYPACSRPGSRCPAPRPSPTSCEGHRCDAPITTFADLEAALRPLEVGPLSTV